MNAGAAPAGPTVTVYSRAGCKLCDQAEAVVRAHVDAARVEVVDVDADERLQARYGVRVPVVAIDGTDLFELHLDPTAFREALARHDR